MKKLSSNYLSLSNLKNFLFVSILFITVGFFSSCQKDDALTIDDISIEKEEVTDFQKRLLSELAISMSEEFTNDVKVIKSELAEIENKYYLTTIWENGYRTNTIIGKNNPNGRHFLMGGKISCTSKTCATNGGCVPREDGKSCTPCNLGFGDCTKTVFSESTQHQF